MLDKHHKVKNSLLTDLEKSGKIFLCTAFTAI